MNDRDIDAEFDAIVAHWDDAPVEPSGPRTVYDITAAYAALSPPETDAPSPPEQVTDEGSPATDDTATPELADESDGDRREGSEAGAESATAPPTGWRGPTAEVDEDEADDDPSPRGMADLPPPEDIGYWGAVIGMVGGPLLLIWVLIVRPFYQGWWTLGSILLFVGGFALLVMRQPVRRDPEDSDDGSRV
ncbi:hypothetical protein [Knoellia sinensis]|nr:hypothetical protein [Knoellia sinensis]